MNQLKAGEKLGIPAFILYLCYLSCSLCHHFAITWNPGRTALMDNVFTRRDRANCPQGKEQPNLVRTDHPQATMTCLS
jgi:hypothetical protein